MKKLIRRVLPVKIIKLIIFFLKGHKHESYSQEGEDMILRRILEKKDSKDIFYIDVGAHHPKRFSNTYYFYKRGASGINIDAMPGSMNLFNKIRPNDINIEKPISDKKEVLTYYAFNEPALNGFSKELSEFRNDKNNDYKIIFKKKIESSTLDDVLNEHIDKNKEIDFLSIDVEGFDFKVLKSLDLTVYKPNLILIEMLKSSFENIKEDEIYLYLKKHQYCLFSKCMNTVIFRKVIDA